MNSEHKNESNIISYATVFTQNSTPECQFPTTNVLQLQLISILPKQLLHNGHARDSNMTRAFTAVSHVAVCLSHCSWWHLAQPFQPLDALSLFLGHFLQHNFEQSTEPLTSVHSWQRSRNCSQLYRVCGPAVMAHLLVHLC